MKNNNKHSKDKTALISDEFQGKISSCEDYIKAASFLAFSNNGEKAIDLLLDGLDTYPDNEKIVRAVFSFMCQNLNVLGALDFADEYKKIFKKDKYNNITKAIDLVRLSLNFKTPKVLNDKDVIEVDHILSLYSEENIYDVPMITIGLMEEYHLPFVGLGIAKWLADSGNDFAQMVLGGVYLKGHHVSKNLNKAIHYLQLSALQDNENAISLLKKAKNRADFN
jgi:hypothetical protein